MMRKNLGRLETPKQKMSFNLNYYVSIALKTPCRKWVFLTKKISLEGKGGKKQSTHSNGKRSSK
jgi:hypothetical protein